jgi:uncharacterized protein (DUF58 family)
MAKVEARVYTDEAVPTVGSTRSVAGLALTTAALFLAVVAVLIGAPALFYMGTALFMTIGACQFQALLAVRGLKFERVAPETARVGDLVTVEITVWSEKRIRRPLISILDNLPAKLLVSQRTPSLPVAPAYDLPIRTMYQFRPLRRGRYRWSGITVEGTDALGLITKRKGYATPPTELTVLPRPIPVNVELPSASGWGISEAESGQTRGAGLEPRGIRSYVPGDSLRHVHWRSSAKTGQLLVKEFEAGSQAAAAFLVQRTKGTEVSTGAKSSLELMIGHALYLAEIYLKQGARIELPNLEVSANHVNPNERVHQLYEILAGVEADQEQTLGTDLLATIGTLPPGSVVFLACAVPDPTLADAVLEATSHGVPVVAMLYNANAFRSGKRVVPIASASDADFVEAMRRAGAHPVLMPTEVDLEG